MSNTSQDLNNSLSSTLKAGVAEMSRSFWGVFGGSAGNKKGTTQDHTNFKPNQITPADTAYEEDMIKVREVKILV